MMVVRRSLYCFVTLLLSSGMAQNGAVPRVPTVPNAIPIAIGTPLDNTVSVSRYEECAEVDPRDLRTEMATRTIQSIHSEGGNLNIDVASIVDREWRRLQMDATIRSIVHQAVEEERANSNYWERLRSGWDKSKAEQLASSIANRAFNSEDFLQALERLSADVSEAIALNMNSVIQRGASASLLCVQEFIGESYGTAVENSFNNAVAQEFHDATIDSILPDFSNADIGMGVSAQTGIGISVIIAGYVARRLLARLGQRISQRLAGKIAQRLGARFGSAAVPVIGWVVGIGLIVFDLVEGNSGAFTLIEEALTAPEISTEIKREVIDAVSLELPTIADDLAQDVSEAIYSQWNSFLRQFNNVLALADREPDFKRFLDVSAARDFDILASLYQHVPEAAIMAAVRDYSLRDFLNLPYPARTAGTELVAKGYSLEHVLAWWNLTGTSQAFNRTIDYNIPQYKRPEELSRDSLNTLLSYQPRVVSKLVLLPPEHLERFLRFSTTNISKIINNNYTTQELLDISLLLGFFENQQDTVVQNRLIDLWAEQPDVVARFSTLPTQRMLFKSRQPLELINFIAAKNSLTHFYEDAFQFVNGNVPWQAMRAKYKGIMWLPLTILAALALLIFSILLSYILRIVRLFRPRAKATNA